MADARSQVESFCPMLDRISGLLVYVSDIHAMADERLYMGLGHDLVRIGTELWRRNRCKVSRLVSRPHPRLALGVAEASFFPTALVVVGGWYPRAKVQSRFSAFYVIGVFSGAFSGLLAYGIHQMDGAGGLESWRW